MKHAITCFMLLLSLSVKSQDDKLVAAGVLPYTHIGDTVYLLLGYDNDKPGWTDFGGGREWVGTLGNEKRLETPKEIATREFFEECRMVYGREEINLNFNPEAYITSASGVYRSYVVKIPYKSRQEFRNALIPIDEKFAIFNEKSDFYWISLDELKTIIRSGGNSLFNSPNQGIIYIHFLETLNIVLQNDALDYLFK